MSGGGYGYNPNNPNQFSMDQESGPMGGSLGNGGYQGDGLQKSLGSMPMNYGGGAPTEVNPYGDYMNRRQSWIDQVRSFVANPQQFNNPRTWGGNAGSGVMPQTAVGPATYRDTGGPSAQDLDNGGYRPYSAAAPETQAGANSLSKPTGKDGMDAAVLGPETTSAVGPATNSGLLKNAGSGQYDFMSQFGNLLAEDPRLAYGMTYGQQQQPWYQANQLQIRDKFFGGDQNRMNSVMNQAAYANPLTAAERARLGI